jgi:hypothetical protein
VQKGACMAGCQADKVRLSNRRIVFWPWGSTKNGLSKTGGNVDGGTSLLYAEDLNVLGTLLGAPRAFLVRQRGRERKRMVYTLGRYGPHSGCC